MHPYSTDSPANPKLIVALTLAAVAVSSAIALVLEGLNQKVGWHLSGLSAMTCFGALYFLFDRHLWKHRWIRRLLLVPDLNGPWICTGKTVLKDGKAVEFPWSGTITVRQSWSRISIVLTTAQSSSASIAASIYQDPSGGSRLIYHYDNDPKQTEHELSRHTGLAKLVFNESADAASGNYFTDRDRVSVGIMDLRRGATPHA